MKGGIFCRNGVFYTNIWSPTDRRKIKERVGLDRQEALARAAAIRAKVLSPAHRRNHSGPVPLLSGYVERVLAEHYAGLRTGNMAKKVLRKFLAYAGDIPLNQVSRGLLEGYKQSRLRGMVPHPFRRGSPDPAKVSAWESKNAKPVAKTTINRELDVLKRMMAHAVENEVLDHNPVALVKKFNDRDTRSRKRTRYLFEHEARAFLAATKESKNPQLHAIVSLALLTGRRRGDILNLKVHDYDRKNGMLHLLNTKHGSPEWIPVAPQAQAILDRIVDAAQSEWMFPNKGGTGPIKDVDTGFRIACRKAGLVGFRFHDLRHSGISFMLMAGLDMMTVARLVGHTTAAMIESRYGHLSPKHKAASAVIFGNYMSRLTGGEGHPQRGPQDGEGHTCERSAEVTT